MCLAPDSAYLVFLATASWKDAWRGTAVLRCRQAGFATRRAFRPIRAPLLRRLGLQGGKVGLAAQRHDSDFARAERGQDHPGRPVSLVDRDVACLAAAR